MLVAVRIDFLLYVNAFVFVYSSFPLTLYSLG